MKTVRKITLSGVIRKRLTEIEAQMFEGVSQSAIVENLRLEGFEISIEGFRQLLYRARKSKKIAGTKSNISIEMEFKNTQNSESNKELNIQKNEVIKDSKNNSKNQSKITEKISRSQFA